MVRRSWLFVIVVVLLLNLVSCNARSADNATQKFPYDKAKKFLMDKGYVSDPKYFNGYYEASPGNVVVYCTNKENNWIGRDTLNFILLKTDTGQKWLYMSDSFPARAFIE